MTFSEADLPVVSSKDTQTEGLIDAPAEGDEKTDDDKSDKKETKPWSIDRIKKEYRRFNIDLAPKVIPSMSDIIYNVLLICKFNVVLFVVLAALRSRRAGGTPDIEQHSSLRRVPSCFQSRYLHGRQTHASSLLESWCVRQ